jgi:Circadian oscillating protein COP23
MKFSTIPSLLTTPTLLNTAVLLGVMIHTNAASPSPLPQRVAQNETTGTVQFVCGQSADPSSRTTLPATVANVSGNPENIVLIMWKSEFFGAKYTPQQRCSIVSSAIDKAFHENRTYIGAGIDKATGLGIVCAVANPEQRCDRSNMLLTMKSYQTADETIQQLGQIMQGKTGQPIYQSSGGKRVNLRDLLIKRRGTNL